MKKVDGTNGTYKTNGTYDFFLRPLGLIGLIGPILFSTIVLAQSTPTPVQSAVGTACGGKANSADFDTIAQCDNKATTPKMQRAPLHVGTVTVPPYDNTKCTSEKAGMIQWDGTSIKACDGSMWVYFVLVDPCTDDNPDIGTICKDGTRYVGKTPDGNVKLFTTRCNLGVPLIPNPNHPISGCEGGGSGVGMTYLSWQTGAAGTGVVTGATSTTSGQSNTAKLVALGSTAPGPYPAAKACDDLVIHGHDDWYLPARDEMQLLLSFGSEQLALGGEVWTSSESDSENVFTLYYGGLRSSSKTDRTRTIRCVRKG